MAYSGIMAFIPPPRFRVDLLFLEQRGLFPPYVITKMELEQ